MAGYQIFTQPTGPQIDINLFPRSASAGIEAGRALPSTATSIISGLTQGVQTGQQLYTGFQQIDLNAENIKQQEAQTAIMQNRAKPENLDIVNETARANLEEQRNRNEITDIALTRAQANKQLITETESTGLEAQKQQNLAAEQYASGYNAVTKAIRNPSAYNTQQLYDMFSGSQYSDVFAKDPNLQIAGLEAISRQARQEGRLDIVDKADFAREEALIRGNRRSSLLKNKDKWEAAIGDAAYDKSIMNILQPAANSYTPEEMISAAEINEAGFYKRQGNGYEMRQGRPVRDDTYKEGAKKTEAMYEIAVPDKNRPGQFKVFGPFPSDRLTKFSAGVDAAGQLQGRPARTQLNNLYRSKQVQQQPTSQFTERFSTPTQQQTLMSPVGERVKEQQETMPVFTGIMRQTLDAEVDDNTFKSIEPELAKVKILADKYQDNTALRADTMLEDLTNPDVDNIVRKIAAQELKTKTETTASNVPLPLSMRYDQAAVDRYNQANNPGFSDNPFAPKPPGMRAAIDTPLDLYLIEREPQLKSLIYTALRKYQQVKTANVKAKAQTGVTASTVVNKLTPSSVNGSW